MLSKPAYWDLPASVFKISIHPGASPCCRLVRYSLLWLGSLLALLLISNRLFKSGFHLFNGLFISGMPLGFPSLYETICYHHHLRL